MENSKKKQEGIQQNIMAIEGFLSKCTGCGACKNICPKNAIEMCEENNGFKYPNIDNSKCIECGKCYESCPLVIENNFNADKPFVFAAQATDTIREVSSSGGMYRMIASDIIKRGGIVFATILDDNNQVLFSSIDSIDAIGSASDSKYIQSEVGLIYREVEKILLEKRLVLFVGCPCHVAGLKGFLGTDYSNLYTVDLVCGGVPSKKMFDDYLNETNMASDIKSVKFRDKNVGWRCDTISFTQNNNAKTIRFMDYGDEYELGYHLSLTTRPSCLNCCFCDFPREGDLSIGDFWGIKNFIVVDNKGTSIIIVNNQKGQHLFDSFKNELRFYQKIDADYSRFNNRLAIERPNANLVARKKFYELYESKKGFVNSVNIALSDYLRNKTKIEHDKKAKILSNLPNVFYIRNLEQLGLKAPASLVEVIRRMPSKSMFCEAQGKYGEPFLDTPLPFGVLTINKATDYFVQISFTRMTLGEDSELYIALWKNNRINKWTKFISSKNE